MHQVVTPTCFVLCDHIPSHPITTPAAATTTAWRPSQEAMRLLHHSCADDDGALPDGVGGTEATQRHAAADTVATPSRRTPRTS